MKTPYCMTLNNNGISLSRVFLATACAVLLAPSAKAQTYTFGPPGSSTPSASITYDSGTGMFQYTDAANSWEDYAEIPLAGPVAPFVTTTNGWTASLTVNLSTNVTTATAANSPGNEMGLWIVYPASGGNQTVQVALGQINNTGGASSKYPNGIYGTVALFNTDSGDSTTPLGNSSLFNGASFLVLSGGTNTLDANESITNSAGAAVLTLSYEASTQTVTGYYNGTPIGSYSPASWGYEPSLTLAVVGSSGEGISVPTGMDAASNFSLSVNLPVQVATTSLSSGTNGVAYNQQLSAIGGHTPYNWSIVSGALPSALTLATNGVISGVPTNIGAFSFTVKVTDASSTNATRPLTLTVGNSPSDITVQPTNNSVTVPVGSNLTFSVSVTGTGPFSYQWQLDGTNLPNGIITTVAGNGARRY